MLIKSDLFFWEGGNCATNEIIYIGLCTSKLPPWLLSDKWFNLIYALKPQFCTLQRIYTVLLIISELIYFGFLFIIQDSLYTVQTAIIKLLIIS
jgi:hypothetical protein